MLIRPMKEEDVKAILAPEEDVLVPRMTLGPKLCPGCGGALSTVAGVGVGTKLNCMACGLELDPDSGFISRIGNAARTVEPEVRMIVKPPVNPDDGA
jgi:hypothetical protein